MLLVRFWSCCLLKVQIPCEDLTGFKVLYVDGWYTTGVEVKRIPLLTNEECHPVFTQFIVRVCVADEVSGVGFFSMVSAANVPK